MNEDAEVRLSPWDWVARQAREYEESGGTRGTVTNGVPCLLLDYVGRRSGIWRRTVLNYGRDGDDYLIVGHESFGRVLAVGPNVPPGIRPGGYVVATVRRPGGSPFDQIGLQDMTTDDVYYERGINLRHGYLAERYRLTQISVGGLSPDAEPSPARIAEVQTEAKEHGITTIFYETLVSPDVATSIAGDLGLKTDVLDPVEGITSASAGTA